MYWCTDRTNSDVSCIISKDKVKLCSVYTVYASSSLTVKYHHESEFKQGRIIALCHDISTRTNLASMRVIYLWNQLLQKSRTQRRAGTFPINVITARNDRHMVHMTVMHHTPLSAMLSRCWSTETDMELAASTIRRRLLKARMSLRRFPLSRNHHQLSLL